MSCHKAPITGQTNDVAAARPLRARAGMSWLRSGMVGASPPWRYRAPKQVGETSRSAAYRSHYPSQHPLPIAAPLLKHLRGWPEHNVESVLPDCQRRNGYGRRVSGYSNIGARHGLVTNGRDAGDIGDLVLRDLALIRSAAQAPAARP